VNTLVPSSLDFNAWPKTPRLYRESWVTEKIDGTNAQVAILPATSEQVVDNKHAIAAFADPTSPTGYYLMFAGSRTRWVTPSSDNYGFAAWVLENHVALKQLGEGRHFGEWWGRGINRNYGLTDRKFSLFNTIRWCLHNATPELIPNGNPRQEPQYQKPLPACVGLVPVLERGTFCESLVETALLRLRIEGSFAAPGFRNPEGIVVFHTAANHGFKVLIENDSQPKGEVVG
jgi:hypothetical protein